MTEEEFMAFLDSRKGLLDAVCVSGGEPTLQPELEDFLWDIKAMGYHVKLDTNGSRPEILHHLVQADLVDYVAMDIKNSPDKYSVTSGAELLEKVEKSAGLLLSGVVDYEFRTTVTGNLHETSDFEKIGQWLAGAKRYFLQAFADSGDILGGDAEQFAVSDEQMASFLAAVRGNIPAAAIRGR
jgi:pyruvate formate lyase activating enzyme